VLGPLLFLIFINDIIYVVKHCKIRLFADDTCLFIEVDNRDEAAVFMNEDLSNLLKWSTDWPVSFAPHKTEGLIISNKTQLNVHHEFFLDGQIIKNVDIHKHLGLTLCHNLRWSCHINDIVTNSSKNWIS
jgi:hypothetical protein